MNKVLIANRGEIACRIIRTCRRLGIQTVAVYSQADKGSLHTRLADQAIFIGPAKASESYLNIDKVLQAAASCGATAVHPGYGFLAENTDFAQAVIDRAMKWIGPSPQSIRSMADKAHARAIAQQAGVPILPGSRAFERGQFDGLEQAGANIGYPLLIKAAAGGGGIGMKLVQREQDLLATAATTQQMALRSFGDGTIFLEKFVENARHIEIQIFGDGKGDAIHLYERDCSIQRRFQKIIEESPATGLSHEIRLEIANSALSLAKKQDYASAGTLEFIFDQDSAKYYFLEMNTRIQVEHPVTEMVTGVDLIAMQLELAFNGTALAQNSIRQRGAAIECRLYAENPALKFLPCPGTLTTLSLPAQNHHLRIDTGYQQGDKVSPYYDPMLAKIISWGENREAALAMMTDALQQIKIQGIETNCQFLLDILLHKAFKQGRVSTKFITLHEMDLNITSRSA